MRGTPMAELVVSGEEREVRALGAAATTAQAVALRGRIVLECAEGRSTSRWPTAFRCHGRRWGSGGCASSSDRLDGLLDEPRPGGPRRIRRSRGGAGHHQDAGDGTQDATHWSTRSLAEGGGHVTARRRRIWRAFGLKPHWSTPSSCQRTRCSSTRCATWWASTWTRRTRRSCCASTRSRRSRPWTAPRPSCLCARASGAALP